MVPDDATEAGRPVRGEVTEPGPFSRLRGHHRFESRCRDPRSGNERGSAGNAVGLPRRDPLAPVPEPYCFGIDVCNFYDIAECPVADWCYVDKESSCVLPADWCDPVDE